MAEQLPEEFLAKLAAVTGKRPRTVIDHILQHGHITTEELRDLYGYGHPPRAVKDVTDLGIPIERFSVKGKDGRTIAAYRFGDPTAPGGIHQTGRTTFSKQFKKLLMQRDGGKCGICGGVFESRYLQIDHRIPYQVAGQTPGEPNPDDYMLLCSSCNRAKSWSCEHCKNGVEDKNPDVCRSCYWANPGNYQHVALMPIRRLDLTWTGEEVSEHDKLKELSQEAREELPEFVKAILRKNL